MVAFCFRQLTYKNVWKFSAQNVSIENPIFDSYRMAKKRYLLNDFSWIFVLGGRHWALKKQMNILEMPDCHLPHRVGGKHPTNVVHLKYSNIEFTIFMWKPNETKRTETRYKLHKHLDTWMRMNFSLIFLPRIYYQNWHNIISN